MRYNIHICFCFKYVLDVHDYLIEMFILKVAGKGW